MKPRPRQSATTPHARGVVVTEDVALDAAARIFRTQGYGTSTVRQIAEAAGMLPGSLHYRYPTKESLLLALAARAVDRAIAAIRAATATSDDATARLRLAARAYVRLLLTSDDAPVLLHEWRALVGAPGRELRAHVRRFEVFLDELVADAIAAGALRPQIDVTLARRFAFGALNWATVWYSPDEGIMSDAIADTFFAFMAYGLVAEGGRPADIDVLFRTLAAKSTPSGG
jgi:AcrR family transcriptional regulator